MRLAPFQSCLVAVAAMLANQAFSQERPAPGRLGCMSCMATAPGRATPSSTSPSSVVIELRPIVPAEFVEIEIALGRLRLVRDRFKIVSNHESFPDGQGDRSLQVSFHHGGPALSASYNDRQEIWSLQLDSVAGAHWTREYTDDGRRVKVVYSQRPHQPIEIVVSGLSAKPFRMSGLSLWHLTEENPAGFSTCVLPSLERLNAAFDLRRTLALAKEIGSKTELAVELGAERLDDQTIGQCIDDLDASERETRAAALERLQQAGLVAYIPLARTLQSELSVQQRQNVERLLDRLEPRAADTPTALAYWLSGGPAWR